MPVHQKDYILRLIEQLGAALSKLLGRIRGGSVEEMIDVERELEAIAQQAGMDLGLARRLSLESLPMLVESAGEIDPSRCYLLAELFYLHGLQAERRGSDSEARESLSRSLYLYRMVGFVADADTDLPDPSERIEMLEKRLQVDSSGSSQSER